MTTTTLSARDYKVADLSQATFGRTEIELAQREMPALMELRREYKVEQPLKGAKIIGCIHMTIQTAVLMETLVDLGAELQWTSCNRFSTQDHAAAAMAVAGHRVWAWKGQSEEEYLWCLRESLLRDGKPWDANILLDDGGDLTALLMNEQPEMVSLLHGVSEETTTGVLRLIELAKEGKLPFPAVDVNASVSKSKNDNRYGVRHSLTDALKRATDVLLSGKKGLVFGYGDVGKGSAASLRAENMIVKVVEVDPLCAMQACFDGYEVVSPWIGGDQSGEVDARLLREIDVVVTATGCLDVCTMPVLAELKNSCIVCNIGHFDNEIDVESMKAAWKFEEIKPLVHRVVRSSAEEDEIILLAEGRLVNLANATGHPSRVMDGSFANQVLAQIHLFQQQFASLNHDEHRQSLIQVKPLRRDLDEKVGALMVKGFGGKLTNITLEQRKYLGLEATGPLKPEEYRY